MKTALIIHGHFYQPPRENPYTGLIEDQVTASPYHNWNESIYQTCYRPNAYSRYLDEKGRVVSIANNYKKISINFGPTLLRWIDDQHPRLIAKLRQAHEFSLSKLGHSNFIAQCYNHVILPLQDPYMQRTQIRWALDDYRTRFGTESEGFWCSECAINRTTVDILAEEGVKFVILSPWQVDRINGKKLHGKPAPCDRAFTVKGKKHSLCAFFYDPELASGISFGHMLRDADALYARLREMKKERKNPSLISCATDGEIYGHHEAFGDMALAALMKKIEDGDEFEVTNFGAYLEKNPPVDEATLSEGDDHLGSSWSCSHGVGRWYRDCGCHTGGSDSWNQKWRTPLREAFRRLEKSALKIFEKVIGSCLGKERDPYEVLLNYSCVMTGSKTVLEYVSSLSEDLSSESIHNIATVLEAMKNVMYMYTSCGWFFNDISGIEPRQNISYAMYAASLLEEFTDENLRSTLLDDLRNAKSNVEEEGDAEVLARKDIPELPSYIMAAGIFATNRKLALAGQLVDNYGHYKLANLTDRTMTLLDELTLQSYNLTYETDSDRTGSLGVNICNIITGKSYCFNAKYISSEGMRMISNWVSDSIVSSVNVNAIVKSLESVECYAYLINADNSLANDVNYRETVRTCLRILSSRHFSSENYDVFTNDSIIRKLVSLVNLAGDKQDRESLMNLFALHSKYLAHSIYDSCLDDRKVNTIQSFLELERTLDYNCDIRELQNAFYFMTTEAPDKVTADRKSIEKLRSDLNFA